MNRRSGTNIDTKLSMWRIIGATVIGGCLHSAVAAAELALGGMADPTRPGYARNQVGEPTHFGPNLQFTIISAGERRAMISGRLYRIGDRFGDGVIAQIEPYEVVVEAGKGERRFRIVPKISKEQVTVTNGKDDAKR